MSISDTDSKIYQQIRKEKIATNHMIFSVFLTLGLFFLSGAIFLFSQNRLEIEIGHSRKNDFPEMKIRLGEDHEAEVSDYHTLCFSNPPYQTKNLVELPLLKVFYWQPQNRNLHGR